MCRTVSLTLLTPQTLGEVLDARRSHPSAVVVAGGTVVVADLNRGAPPQGLISLQAVEELRGLRFDGGRWRLGAMATVAEVRANADLAPPSTALGQATRSLGSRQIRNRATVGGNICAGGAQRTLVPVLLAYDAAVDVSGPAGPRTVVLSDVLLPERAPLGAGEILTAVHFAPPSGPQRYYRVGPRNANCYATASVTVVLDEPARSVRVALGGVAPTAVRAPEAEALAGAAVDWDGRLVSDDVAASFGAAAAEAADPVSDVMASADYRSHAVEVMARRALRHIFEEDGR